MPKSGRPTIGDRRAGQPTRIVTQLAAAPPAGHVSGRRSDGQTPGRRRPSPRSALVDRRRAPGEAVQVGPEVPESLALIGLTAR